MSDTTTVSEPRPVSALEQTLWKYASWNSQNYEQERTGNPDERRGRQDAFRQSAIVVHERDAQLFALAEECEARADRHGDKYTEYDYLAERLRAILEGPTDK